MRLLLLTIILIGCASESKEVSVNRKKAEIYYNRGTEQLVQKEYTGALKHLLEAHRLRPEDTRILNNLGMAYYFKKRPKTAIKYINKAIELDPKNTRAKLNIATLYMESKNYDLARKNFNAVLEDLTFDQQYRTYYNLGVLATKENKTNQALNFFNQSITENASYCPAHFQIGLIQYEQARYEAALESFKNASKGTCYENPEPLYHQALTYLKLNQVAFAKDKLEDIIGRFSGTKYAKTAQRKLNAINVRLDQYEAKVLRGENPYRQILTPDF